jgi:hypothetical protein
MSIVVVGSALAIAVLLFAWVFASAARRQLVARQHGGDSSSWSAGSDSGSLFVSSDSGTSCDAGSSDGGGGCDGGGGGD